VVAHIYDAYDHGAASRTRFTKRNLRYNACNTRDIPQWMGQQNAAEVCVSTTASKTARRERVLAYIVPKMSLTQRGNDYQIWEREVAADWPINSRSQEVIAIYGRKVARMQMTKAVIGQ